VVTRDARVGDFQWKDDWRYKFVQWREDQTIGSRIYRCKLHPDADYYFRLDAAAHTMEWHVNARTKRFYDPQQHPDIGKTTRH
jgi:hypothetical protein